MLFNKGCYLNPLAIKMCDRIYIYFLKDEVEYIKNYILNYDTTSIVNR
jgi:hypothetical protein